jgi:hypothetical protein
MRKENIESSNYNIKPSKPQMFDKQLSNMLNKEHIQRENFASKSMKRLRKKKIEITPNNDHGSLGLQLKD